MSFTTIQDAQDGNNDVHDKNFELNKQEAVIKKPVDEEFQEKKKGFKDFPDSPILFLSNELDNQEEKNTDDEEDCYEVDNKSCERKLSQDSGRQAFNFDHLQRKRKRCETEESRVQESGTALHTGSKLTTDNPKDLCLHRAYKKPQIETLEEADKCDLLYAPKKVNSSLYTAVIIRKLEEYRLRLRKAQSCLPPVREMDLKGFSPITSKTRSRIGRHVLRRTNMVKCNKSEKGTKEKDAFSLILQRLLLPEQPEVTKVVHVLDKVNHTKNFNCDNFAISKKTVLSSPKSRQSPETPTKDSKQSVSNFSSTQTPVIVETSRDASLTIAGVHDEPESKSAKKSNVPIENLDEIESKEKVKEPHIITVKPIVRTSSRESVLKDSTCDGQSDVNAPTVDTESIEIDCLEVSTSPVVNDTSPTPSQPDEVECPMCYRQFSIEEVEQHAYHCNGPGEQPTNLERTNEEGELSPVIKTRIPTRVKELQLLTTVQRSAMKQEFISSKDDVKSSNKEEKGKKGNKRKHGISLEPYIALEDLSPHCGKTGNWFSRGNPGTSGMTKGNPGTSGVTKSNPGSSGVTKSKLGTLGATKSSQSFSRANSREESKTMEQNHVDSISSWKRPTLSRISKNLGTTSLSDDISPNNDLVPLKAVEKKKQDVLIDDPVEMLTTKRTDDFDRKRKINGVVDKRKIKKGKMNGDLDTEHCYMCGEDIPRSLFDLHVDEELARKRQETDDLQLPMSPSAVQESQDNLHDLLSSDEKSSLDSRRPLPDFAEDTTFSNEESDSSERTYKSPQGGSLSRQQLSFYSEGRLRKKPLWNRKR